jgi:hypothetical protein
MTISLGCVLPRISCSLPEATSLTAWVASSHLPRGLPLLDLAPGGGCLATSIAARAGGLLHHLFTLTVPSSTPPQNQQDLGEAEMETAVCFCGPIRQVAPSRGLPGALLYGVRTFLNGGKPLRSSGQPGELHHTIIYRQLNRLPFARAGGWNCSWRPIVSG